MPRGGAAACQAAPKVVHPTRLIPTRSVSEAAPMIDRPTRLIPTRSVSEAAPKLVHTARATCGIGITVAFFPTAPNGATQINPGHRLAVEGIA
jgi:hypothetical protein